MEKPLNVFLLGRSGCGKGTQVKLLKEKLLANQKVYTSSTGDLLRELEQQQTDVGIHLHGVLARGGLAPKALAVSMWLHKMAWSLQNDEGMLFEGSPRSVWEAQGLDEVLAFLERDEYAHVIYIDVSAEEVKRRLIARGRQDDTEASISSRLAFFEQDVKPVIEHYRAKGMLIEVNGEQSVEQVHEDIVQLLGLSNT